MRFVRGSVVLLLIVSLAINAIGYVKLRGTRSIFSVNGQGFSKRDLDNYLEAQAGPAVKAQIVERMLAEQEAERKHVLPTDAEVEQEFNNQRELNWQFAMRVDNSPWYADSMKEQIKLELCKQRLRTLDVPVSQDEMQTEYNNRSSVYDVPNKAKCILALLKDPSSVNDVKQLIANKVEPATIREKYSPNVLFLGDHNVFTFIQPFGDTRAYHDIFSRHPGDVIQLPPTQDFAQQGIRQMVVRVDEIVPGHKADLNDATTKEKLRVNVALRRSRPWQEILAGLWSACKFESEDPRDRRYIEGQFFPDRVN
jgi:hypothetical protein